MKITDLREGDVIRYESATGRRGCRENMAVVERRDTGLVALDTYWSSDRDALSESELAGARVLFNLNDVREVSAAEQMQYAEADRFILTSQHGHRATYFVPKDATPDAETIRANQRYDVLAAADRVASARADLLDEVRRLREVAPGVSSSDLIGACSVREISPLAAYCDAHLYRAAVGSSECDRRGELIARLDAPESA